MALPKPETAIETTTIAAKELNLGDALGRVRRHETRIVLADDGGEPVGAIVSLSDLRAVELVERQRAELMQLMDTVSARFSDLSEEELDREIWEAIAEVEADRRRLPNPEDS